MKIYSSLRLIFKLPRQLINIMLTGLLVVSLAAACGKIDGNVEGGKVVAEYDGGIITEEEFAAYVAYMIGMQVEAPITDEESQQKILKRLIAEKVLSSRASEEARKLGVEEGEKGYAEMIKRINAKADFKMQFDEMKKNGLTEKWMKQFTLNDFIVLKDRKLQHDTNIAKLKKSEFVSGRQILIGFEDKNKKERQPEDALNLAQKMKERLDSGGDWAKLVEEYSDDRGSADKGGLYEKADLEKWGEAFEDAVKKLSIGKISNPIKSSFGYHIAVVDERNMLSQKEWSREFNQFMNFSAMFIKEEVDKLIQKIDLPDLPSRAENLDIGENETVLER